MDPLEEKKIDELIELERENNTMLRKMRRGMLWGQWMTVIYWLFIIGGLGWAYYKFQPYVEEYLSVYDTVIQAVKKIDEGSRALPGNIKGLMGSDSN